MSLDTPELEMWARTAARWVQDADDIAHLTATVSNALLKQLQVSPGASVLDVAAGVGDPALRLAEAVGPEGSVLAVDGVPEMLAELARRAETRGLTWLRTRCQPAEQLDLESGIHDAACSRFGAMFFRDLPGTLAAMARAVRSGGRLALVVWAGPECNPHFRICASVLDELAGPCTASDNIQTVFELATPGHLLALARSNGWPSAIEAPIDFAMRQRDVTPDGWLDRQIEQSDRLAARVADLDEELLAEARTRVAQQVAGFVTGADLEFPARALMVSATVSR